MRKVLEVLPAILLMAACGPTEDPGRELTAIRVQMLSADNTNVLNGRTLNGRTLNGADFSGVLVSSRNDSITLADGRAVHATLQAGALTASVDGVTLQARDFEGARLTGRVENGATVPLRISRVTTGTGINSDLFLYDVDYYDAATDSWNAACLSASGQAAQALAVKGYWNYGRGVAGGGSFHNDDKNFTFACVTGAIGKCVLWGYRPWGKYAGKSLAAYHQACTRMVRADFCGNGTSYTQDGNPIDIYDNLGLQLDTEDWSLEAQWTPHGAHCFRAGSNRATVPVTCYKSTFEAECADGNAFDEGVLLVTEVPSK